MNDMIKVEVELPALPEAYRYTGEYRHIKQGEIYYGDDGSIWEWSDALQSKDLCFIVKKTIKIIDPFDSSDDIDLEFSNNGGKWYLFNRRDMRFCKNAPYAYRNAELCLDFERCRVRQNHRFVRVEGTRPPEGILFVLRNPAGGDPTGSVSTGAGCLGDRILNMEAKGSAEGYKYEWE